MKRCPECRRDYHDDSLAYCLDDGCVLVDGPAAADLEPATAIIGAATEQQTHILTTGDIEDDRRAQYATSSRSSLIAGVFGVLVITALGIGIYIYYARSASKQIDSIAVMPFVNDSGNADLEFLSDGMTETLIRSLSQLPNLNVKARSSVFRYKGKDTDPKTIAADLKVQAVLNGSVRQRGDQIILDLELLDPITENVIWTKEYDRKQTDLATLQSDIAVDVLDRLRTKLTGSDKGVVARAVTTDSTAYQAYLKGRYHWNRRTPDDLQKAIEQFKTAIDLDSNFALAYTGLADTYSVMPYYVGCRSAEMMRQARPFAERAVELDDQLPEAHTALAFVNEGTWNFADAEREYKRALELNPNYTTALYRYARFLVRVPYRLDDAIAKINRTLELEPAHLVANGNLSEMYLSQGNADLALEQAKRTNELDPAFLFGWSDIAYALAGKGQMPEALAAAEQAAKVGNGSSRSLMVLGFVEGLAGKRSEAIAIARTLENNYLDQRSDAVEVAAVYSGLGDKDEAFRWLEHGFEDHSSLMVDIRAEYQFAPLYDDPRFKDLLKRMNMPE